MKIFISRSKANSKSLVSKSATKKHKPASFKSKKSRSPTTGMKSRTLIAAKKSGKARSQTSGARGSVCRLLNSGIYFVESKAVVYRGDGRPSDEGGFLHELGKSMTDEDIDDLADEYNVEDDKLISTVKKYKKAGTKLYALFSEGSDSLVLLGGKEPPEPLNSYDSQELSESILELAVPGKGLVIIAVD